jgi:hypothetical protein
MVAGDRAADDGRVFALLALSPIVGVVLGLVLARVLGLLTFYGAPLVWGVVVFLLSGNRSSERGSSGGWVPAIAAAVLAFVGLLAAWIIFGPSCLDCDTAG